MKRDTFLKLGLAWLAVGCTTSSESHGGRPSVTAAAVAPPVSCPLGVNGALVTTEETDTDVTLTFLAPPAKLDELRERVRHAAAMHGPGAHEGLGHDGAHGQGGQHGLQAFQLPPARATAEDIEGGARLKLMPANADDEGALADRVRQAAARMNGAPCDDRKQ